MNLTPLKLRTFVRLAKVTSLAATAAFAFGGPPTAYTITVKMEGKPVMGAEVIAVPTAHPDAAYTLGSTEEDGTLDRSLGEGSYTLKATSGKATGSARLVVVGYSPDVKSVLIIIK